MDPSAAAELKSPSEAGEIERRISPRTKLDGGWDKLHFQRAERRLRDRERARYICMTMCSIHPEAGEREVGTLSTDRLTGLHGERGRERIDMPCNTRGLPGSSQPIQRRGWMSPCYAACRDPPK